MPNFDGTGPKGMGSRSGRGFGRCFGMPGMGWGAGPGRGRGLGLGQACWFCGRSWSEADEKNWLEDYKTDLKQEIELVDKALTELD
ncbi:MAG: hypothetical protein GF390_04200 [Candidatus Pacebacteria bacterium]|nr:hypothetical protein [Candidatus Paceibacterota bacterium]